MISVFLASTRDFWMAMVKDDLSVWPKFTLGLRFSDASLIHSWVTSSNSSSSYFFIRNSPFSVFINLATSSDFWMMMVENYLRLRMCQQSSATA